MTWLSEIEEETRTRKRTGTGLKEALQKARMAHVIRELAGVARLFREGKRAAVYSAIDSLSPDAKEVVMEVKQ